MPSIHPTIFETQASESLKTVTHYSTMASNHTLPTHRRRSSELPFLQRSLRRSCRAFFIFFFLMLLGGAFIVSLTLLGDYVRPTLAPTPSEGSSPEKYAPVAAASLSSPPATLMLTQQRDALCHRDDCTDVVDGQLIVPSPSSLLVPKPSASLHPLRAGTLSRIWLLTKSCISTTMAAEPTQLLTRIQLTATTPEAPSLVPGGLWAQSRECTSKTSTRRCRPPILDPASLGKPRLTSLNPTPLLRKPAPPTSSPASPPSPSTTSTPSQPFHAITWPISICTSNCFSPTVAPSTPPNVLLAARESANASGLALMISPFRTIQCWFSIVRRRYMKKFL
ncbi:hypothetical protein K458DRAFT_388210 [Lentithecium fluviatile CBS 122367]|uniref:Uncharacterized protein n=1 Tax=Lentithecium fluviatile CBS 122367 TaxID=1168545 RepID=A0A6G1J512_9PLEO|nr:hypothetical protein K458DRAFT_388210 [Lentithecium fluviatile CBS 122367]